MGFIKILNPGIMILFFYTHSVDFCPGAGD